jgi:hypothetical protein
MSGMKRKLAFIFTKRMKTLREAQAALIHCTSKRGTAKQILSGLLSKESLQTIMFEGFLVRVLLSRFPLIFCAFTFIPLTLHLL